MQIVPDAEKRYRWNRCPLCGKRYKQYAGAPLGACDECLGELCDAFWAIYNRNHPPKDGRK
jgi:protein-arginine kinase activator protein McsA